MRNLSLFLVCALLVSGCAFGTRRPYLDYQVTTPAKQANNISITVNPLSDERTWSKEKIGDVRNGYGMRCADIIPQNSVTEWIRAALVDELKNAGYNVVDSDAQNVVSGEVTEVYCNAYMRYGGRVGFHLSLKKDGASVMDKKYEVEKSSGVAWASTAESFGNAMKFTLQDAMKQVITDVDGALGQK
jgi:hypothetical protein